MDDAGGVVQLFVLETRGAAVPREVPISADPWQVRPTTYALFTAPQSLGAYALPICIVATVTRAARTILRTEADSLLVPLAASLTVALLLLALASWDRRTRPRGVLDWTTAASVATVNALVLFAAAIGIEKF